jgi:hypothetical protein
MPPLRTEVAWGLSCSPLTNPFCKLRQPDSYERSYFWWIQGRINPYASDDFLLCNLVSQKMSDMLFQNQFQVYDSIPAGAPESNDLGDYHPSDEQAHFALNYLFTPLGERTVVHEVGHALGLSEDWALYLEDKCF